jgi:hypothetical protein
MKDRLSIQYLSSLIIRIILSLVCAGITYFVWMGLFILMADSIGPLMKGFFWIAAPVTTAMGFATGVFVHERVTVTRKATFPAVLIWPLLGCSAGALTVYWRGPMLIVFGMFAVGTASVVLRELVLRSKESQNQEIV